MSTFHAVAFVDHQSAQALQFDSEHVVEHKGHENLQFTRHMARVRTEHEFFGQVSDALDGIAEVLVAGATPGWRTFDTTSRHTGH